MSASTSVVETAAAQCISFGPYPDEQAAVLAQARLQPLAQRVVARTQPRGSARGWRVMLPALPDTAQAEATAARIAAAGFSDYFVVREGSEANSIALGRYGNETAARRRSEALVAAGFAARAEAIGGTVTWLDVLATADIDASTAQQLAAAPERRPLDCAALR
jgi:cell division septation protein DedD